MPLDAVGLIDTANYARISEDRRDGAGIARQLADCHGLCARRGWSARDYTDNNRSAWRVGGSRPRYLELLEAVRSGEIHRVVVYKTDRLYRQPRELEELIALADRGRVEIVSVEGGELDLGTSDGRALARVLAAMNAKESDDKADRVRSAKKQARARGEPHGGPRPFGWARRIVTLADGTEKTTWDAMAHDPTEAQLIRDAVDELLAGQSLRDVARRWCAVGVGQPQTGKANWTADAVRQVVSNPRNAGLVGHREPVKTDRPYQLYTRPEVVGEAKWPPIVERARWEQLMAFLADRGASRKVPKNRSLLTGLLLCGLCGATMVRTADHARRNPPAPYRKVWRCPTYERLDPATGEKVRSCGRTTIDAVGVQGLLETRAQQKAEGLDLAAIAQESTGGGREAADLVGHLTELDERADAAATSFAKGSITLRVLERSTADIERERATLRERLAELSGSALLAPYAGSPASLREAWSDRLTTDQKRELIRVLLGPVRILPARRGVARFDPERVVGWRA